MVSAAWAVEVACAELRYRTVELEAALLAEKVAALEESASAGVHVRKKKFGKRAARKLRNRGVWWRPMRQL